MMNKEGTQEILIIRRGGGDGGDGHHGGAWKIAYADFVTAMMAFFLVMWLINSANEVTKARVASYFNPIKMTDASPATRGLKEQVDSQTHKSYAEAGKPGGGASAEKTEGKPVELAVSEDKLLMNPYAMLDELVKQSDQAGKSGAAPEDNSVQGDPFNPRSFEHLQELQVTTQQDGSPGDMANPGTAKEQSGDLVGKGQAKSAQTEQPLNGTPGTKDGTGPAEKSAVGGMTEQPEKGLNATQEGAGPAQKSAVGGTAEKPATLEKGPDAVEPKPGESKSHSPEDLQLAQEFRQQIEQEIAKYKGEIDLNAHVKVTDEGLLIILEDGSGRSMFSVGSAQPNPALIKIIGDIGGLLSKTDGNVVIRGHTDGRQFRNRKYDNWQLSTDRAHMASYMLIRGGLAEARIKRIEGYGSSSPVVPGDTMLDANRRVEFLLTR